MWDVPSISRSHLTNSLFVINRDVDTSIADIPQNGKGVFVLKVV